MSHHIQAVVPFSHGSNDNGLIVVMFCSDLNVKRCEGNRACLLLFLMQHVKVSKFGRLIVTCQL